MNTDSAGQARTDGIGRTLTRVVSTVLKLISTRLDQAVVELEIEFHNTMSAVLWGVLMIATGCLALGFLGVMVVLAFRDSHPLLASIGVAVAFVLIAVYAALRLRRALRSQGSGMTGLRQEVAADLSMLHSTLHEHTRR